MTGGLWLPLVALLVAAVCGDVAVRADADAAAGANPIRRVVNLLETMARKVEEEGKKEEQLYEKFMCYCKTNGADLAKAIAESTAQVPQLQTDIEEAESALKQLEQELKSHQEDRASAKAAIEAATAQREAEQKHFSATSGEYKGYLEALEKAVSAIEGGMAGGFLQTGVGSAARQAIANDVSVTDYDKQLVTAFLSGGVVGAGRYAPKGGEVLGILKTIAEDFQKSLDDVVAKEQESVALFEQLLAAKTKQVEVLGSEVERKTARTGELGVSIANMKNDLTETEAALIANKKFAAEVEKSCATKTSEWDVRCKTRSEELVAIRETIKLLNDDDALDLFKKTLPSPSLLQVKASQKQVQRRALAVVQTAQRAMAGRPTLDFLVLALSGRKVDFTKVQKMIDEMVTLLQKEQLDDDNKKEYCQKQIDLAEDRAKDHEKRIEDLQTSIAQKEEALAAVTAELKELAESIEALDKSVQKATEQRKDEHEEYLELIASNKAAKELLSLAKNRLNKFYNPGLYKEKAGSLLQLSVRLQRAVRVGREEPPATWEGGYGKKAEESTGVLAMLDLLIRDLEKETVEAETEEKDAQRDYEVSMDDAAKKRAASQKAVAVKETSKADLEEGRTGEVADLKAEQKNHKAAKMYEMQLHQECDWLLANFELRKQARAEEADTLKQAKAILAGADFSLAQNGQRRGRARHLRGL